MKWADFILFGVLLLSSGFVEGYAQENNYPIDTNAFFQTEPYLPINKPPYFSFVSDTLNAEVSELPTPRSVLFKSLMVPGWGQIENKQIWKVPIIYGMFAGVGFYTAYLNNQYKDYRAAYYNSHQGEDNDFKFGPTPDYLAGVGANQLQANRNSFRNQRDFMFIVMGLAYGLNVLDAYIFAHMRSFDVSDDLSASVSITPAVLDGGNPGMRVQINIY